MNEFDEVTRPKHYNSHPSGIECKDFRMLFYGHLSDAVKYLWRAGLKGDDKGSIVKDLRKAIAYIEFHQESMESCAEYRESCEYHSHEFLGLKHDFETIFFGYDLYSLLDCMMFGEAKERIREMIAEKSKEAK